jgi:hypothetical protein
MDSILQQFLMCVFQYGNSFRLIFRTINFTARTVVRASRSHRRDRGLGVNANSFAGQGIIERHEIAKKSDGNVA